jgi:hypothetical protein
MTALLELEKHPLKGALPGFIGEEYWWTKPTAPCSDLLARLGSDIRDVGPIKIRPGEDSRMIKEESHD